MANVADYNVANASGASVRSDINNILQAVVTLNSGTSEPSTMYPFMIWVDTNSNVVKMRNGANDAWLTMPFAMNASNTAPGGLTVSGSNLTLDGVDIAKSGSADLTLDSGGRIDLSADDNGEVRLFDGASNYGQFKDDEDRLTIQGLKEDKDMLFVVNDGSVATTAMKIIAADAGDVRFYGRVGIGGTPSSYNSNTNNFVIRDSGNGGMTISTGASSTGYVAFNDGEDTTIEGLIAYNQSNDVMSFRTAGTDDRLVIDGSGNIGMGTASPSTNLHIYSTANNAPHLLLENFQNADTDDAAVIELYLNDQTTGGIGDDTDVGVIRFTGDEKDGGTKETYAEIRGVAHDPGQGASNKGNLSFFVQTAGDLNETLKLDEDKVVIGGDAVPDELLHIYDRNAAPKIRFEQFDSSGAPTSGDVVGGIEWSINDDSSFSGADTVRTKILSVIEGTTAQTALTFSTGASSAASAEKMRLTNDGKLTVGATTASHKIEAHSGGIGTKYDGTNHVAIRGLSGGQYIQYSSSTALSFVAVDTYPNSGASTKAQIATNGDFYTNDGTVSSLSDERIKTNVIDLSDGLEIVNQLRPITYEYNNEFESDADLGVKDGVTRYGFIAQEVETIAPQYVNQSEGKINGESVDDLRSLSQTKMIPMLVKSIQEQQEQIEELKQQINELRGN
jgi:hypothetical protein